MKKVLILFISILVIFNFSGCTDSSASSSSNENIYTQDDMAYEKENSYDAGYEAGYQDGIHDGVNNPGDYIDSEDVEDLEDIIDEYAGDMVITNSVSL